jgi:TIGR03009 family protein
MARMMLGMVFCGLFFIAGMSSGQTTPSTWPTPNPMRPENQPNQGNPPVTQPNNTPGSQYPATQANNPPNDRYPAVQPGNPTDNRYQSGNAAGGATDNRYPQPHPQGLLDQPVHPQYPTLQRRLPLEQAKFPTPLPPPFVLTPAEQAQVDQILNTWEQKSRDVKTFDCKVVRFGYDLTFPVNNPKAPPGSPPLPNDKDQGILKYAAPDKGLYRIIYTDKLLNDKWEPIPPERIEHWMCDGNSVYEYKYPTDPNDPKKPGQVIEHPLPPDMKGKAIADGPLPFLFGADAKKLSNRYYFKIIPASDPQKEIWLDAYPKTQQDAANFSHARIILVRPEMTPKGLQLILPSGKNYISYVFFDTVINDRLRLFQGNPFQPYTPRGWQRITEPAPDQGPQSPQPAQAGRAMGPTR